MSYKNLFNSRTGKVRMIQYIPTEKIMDSIYTYFSDKKSLNFFLDFKNALVWNYDAAQFMEEITAAAIIDTFYLMTYIKRYYQRRFNNQKRIRFILFTEQGSSLYHKRLVKDYKDNRQSNIPMAIKDEYFKGVAYAVDTLKPIINKIPNMFFFKGEGLEFDFIPYFFLQENYIRENEGVIIMSCDKDHLQTVIKFNNVLQMDKSYQASKNVEKEHKILLLNRATVLERFFKKDIPKEDKEYLLENFSLIRAIIGDGGDNIKGVPLIGLDRALPVIKELQSTMAIKPISEIRDFLYSTNESCLNSVIESENFSIFNHKDFNIAKSKKAKMQQNLENATYTITRNIGAMDFDVILKKNSHIKKELCDIIFNKEKLLDYNLLKNAIVKSKLLTKEDSDELIDWEGLYLFK